MTLALVAALLAALGYAAASVLQAVGVRGGSGAAQLVRSPLYLAGLGCDGVAWLLSLIALRRLPTFAVQSLLAGSLALTVVLARVFLASRLRRIDAIAVGLTVLALGVVAAAGTDQPAVLVPRSVEASILVATGICVLLVPLSRRSPSVVHTVLAGVAYSLDALAARAVDVPPIWWHVLGHPLAWAVVVAGVVGTLEYAAALARGPVGPATALLWAVEVVVPALAGVFLLGDDVRVGWVPALVVALVVVVTACVVLAGSPAVPEEGS
ncbi:MAG: hypothetical protein ACRYF3_14690 [Janthinobacterium lividum]